MKDKITLKNLLKAAYFITAFVLVIVSIPHKGKFSYEFQIGKIWMHDDLYAQFDFPIYKTESELIAERNKILKKVNPFFRLDSTIRKDIVMLLENDLRTSGERLAVERSSRSDSEFNGIDKELEQDIVSMISGAYQRGIIDRYDIIEESAVPEIQVMEGNVSHIRRLDRVFTRSQALEYITSGLNDLAGRYHRQDERAFIESVDPNRYIKPNLIYDEGLTERYKNELIGKISLTRGVVPAGQLIISKGDMVTADTYRVLSSLKNEYENKIGRHNLSVIVIGNAILIASVFILLFLFLYSFKHEILEQDSKLLFILMLITFMVVASAYFVKGKVFNIYTIPLVIVPIFIRNFFDSRLALFIHLVTIFIISFIVPNAFEFVFINFVAGVVAIISLTNFYRRGRLFLTVGVVWATYIVLHVGLITISKGSPLALSPVMLLWFSINALLLLASYQLIYVFEKLFGFLSEATLIELSDTNQKLLRELAELAPGTFQHSLQVANLAETAARAIGGDSLLVRAGALYHDIGKLGKPLFFIENQVKEFNPHKNLEYTESAAIIIDHVTRGVKIARKEGLPDKLIDFIRTHHGTSKVRYFFQLHCDKFTNGADDIDKFTYPGPIPNSKEAAIVMMADAVEAASRSMSDITEAKIDEMVDSLIALQQNEGQFNDADITFKEISMVKSVLKRKLVNIYHARIEYPKAAL